MTALRNRFRSLLPAQLKRLVREQFLPAPQRNPRHIPAALGVAGVIAELDRRKIRYVALRWFEALPELPAGGDLDLLVCDEDIAALDRVLGSSDGDIECDVYGVSGRLGTDYSGTPHLPPKKAAELLDRAIMHRGAFRVPCPIDHFRSLAFHSVYHKGFKTGLRSRYPPPGDVVAPKNDYRGALSRLASELGIEVELSLEGLDAYLVANGWVATREMMVALSRRNAWVAARLNDRESSA